jgi:hypothetical protein
VRSARAVAGIPSTEQPVRATPDGARIWIQRNSDVGVLIAERGALISSNALETGHNTWLGRATGGVGPEHRIDELPGAPWAVSIDPFDHPPIVDFNLTVRLDRRGLLRRTCR